MTPSSTTIYRYPGVKPFKTTENYLFFGRSKDIQDLFDLIQVEKIVTLFGKSGYGKSSLINAGFIPFLNNLYQNEPSHIKYEPILVRFGEYSSSNEHFIRDSLKQKEQTPLRILLSKINDHFGESSAFDTPTHLLKTLGAHPSLWYELKRRQIMEQPKRIVLIFDQFEEFFTYPAQAQNLFKSELAELLYRNKPQIFKNSMQEIPRQARLFLSEELDVRVLFVIRSDRMSLLDGMKSQFPAILFRRLQLKALTVDQAKEAIILPASLPGTHFSSPPFVFTDAAVEKMLKELITKNVNLFAEEGLMERVEAFQLQILCEFLETEVRNSAINKSNSEGYIQIDVEHLPEMANLYDNYYNRKLNELNPEFRKFAQIILEEGLLIEEANGEGRRMSVDSRALISQFKLQDIGENILEHLADTFLIRPESNSVGGTNYEISHDTLVPPIQFAKNLRKKKEAETSLIQQQLFTEKLLNEEAQKRKAAESTSYKMRLLAGGAILFFIIAFAAFLIAFRMQKEAQKALEDYKKAIAEKEHMQITALTQEFEIKLKDAYGQLIGEGSCVEPQTASRIKNLARALNDTEINKKIDQLNLKILKSNASCPIIKLK